MSPIVNAYLVLVRKLCIVRFKVIIYTSEYVKPITIYLTQSSMDYICRDKWNLKWSKNELLINHIFHWKSKTKIDCKQVLEEVQNSKEDSQHFFTNLEIAICAPFFTLYGQKWYT